MSLVQRRARPDAAGRSRWTRLTRLVAIPVALALTTGVASAYWTAGSVAGGHGASATTTVNQGTIPTASAAKREVTVSWAASTLANGTPVNGYIVNRYDALAPQTILSGCTGRVAATTCTEVGVPVGTWTYSVTPVFATNWRGAESAQSSPVRVDWVELGTAGAYSVLAGTGVTSTGATNLSGDLGVSPLSSVTGFPPGEIGGTIHAGDPEALQAQADLASAYDDAAARTPTVLYFPEGQSGQTFDAGIYRTTAAFALTGTLTLDGKGNPNAVFIFQIGGAMTMAASSHVKLVNGAQASHVFWQVAGAAGTGALSKLSGTVMAKGAITLGAGTELIGRALSTGLATLGSSTVRFTAAMPPVVTIDGGPTGVTKNPTPTISGTTNAPAASTVIVRVAGQLLPTTVQGDGTWSVTASALTAGLHEVVASVRDAAGNAGLATQELTVEINPIPVMLRTAGTYSVLGGTGVVNTGATSLSGDLGVSPSNSVVGFPEGAVGGEIHAGDALADQAKADFTLAYADADARTPAIPDLAGDQGGKTFHSGVYHTAVAFALTGTLTLDGEDNPDAVFIFQIDAAMNTAANSEVDLIRGAQASNVFWQVLGAAGTGDSSTLSGTIMAKGAITLGASTQLTGRALSYGTVTLASNSVSLPTADLTGPVGGSVDAAGLVGTGSRYSTSTTLNLDLAKGTDSNGVAATGALLSRATATLTSAGTTDGGCGTFGVYTLVSGGTDPASPKSDTVDDQACYTYKYVVADRFGIPTTYTSPAIKVDTTEPAAPTLAFTAFTNTYWSGAAPTVVYYRSSAAIGSFTTTAGATDPASGITSYAFLDLGANWTSTPVALGVNTYAWNGTPAAPGTKKVTATNHATGISPDSPFDLTADDTAPNVGTVAYLDGTTAGTSVSVDFTTGTDVGGSGVGTRLLQRATTTLTDSTCGTFGLFSDVEGGINPTSPFVDTVDQGFCYQYRYVTMDNVGNEGAPATSASVARIS